MSLKAVLRGENVLSVFFVIGIGVQDGERVGIDEKRRISARTRERRSNEKLTASRASPDLAH